MLNYANDNHLKSNPVAWHANLIQDINDLYLAKDCTKQVAIDIGASYGWMSVPMSSVFKHVYSFEIIPTIRDCLKLNTASLSNVHVMDSGLSSISGSVPFKVLPNSGVSRVCHVSDSNSVLQVKRLDDFQFDHVDLIKIDVEDHEMDVLVGAKDTLTNNTPLLVVECNYVERLRHHLIKRQEIISYLLSLKYSLIDFRGHDLIFTKKNTNIQSYLDKFKTTKSS